jgi:hypothetical protein
VPWAHATAATLRWFVAGAMDNEVSPTNVPPAYPIGLPPLTESLPEPYK